MASKSTPEINGGSMADIAFLMLIFFLMVTTMDSELGLSRRLPPMPAENQKAEDIKVNRRNILEVKITSKDAILAGSKVITDVRDIEEVVINFLTNPNGDEKLSAKKTINIEGFGDYQVSEGVISLQNDRSTHYDVYLKVQDVLVKAVNKIRDDFSMQNFGQVYTALDMDKQRIVRKAIPQVISEQEPFDSSKKR